LLGLKKKKIFEGRKKKIYSSTVHHQSMKGKVSMKGV
jgi:hypothetical protein